MEPIRSVKRWIKEKEKKSITQRAIIATYNSGMSGVDLLDGELSNMVSNPWKNGIDH